MKLLGSTSITLAAFLSAITFSNDSVAGTSKFSGSVEAEVQYFPNEGNLEEQEDLFGSIAIRPEYYWRSENKDHKVKMKLFYRATEPNGSRTHGDVREFTYLYSNSGWYVKTGVDIVFWGVTESAHLVDVINQTDNVESISGEEKLGQPMIAVGVEKDFGNVDAYILPYFRTRQFPSGPERYQITLLDQSPEVDDDENFYESDDEENNIDLALRWYKSFDDFDVGLSYFNGTSRDPLPVIADLTGALQKGADAGYPGTAIVDTLGSYYEQQQQLGLEFQYLYEDWIFKLEATHQLVDSGDYSEMAAGFEYTFSDLDPWGHDLGVLVEYLYNDRGFVELGQYSIDADPNIPDKDDPNLDEIREVGVDGFYLSPMQNDLFLGMRFALNNIDGTEFLAGIIHDLDDDTTSMSFEGSTRVGNNLRLTTNVYYFNNVYKENPFKAIENDDLIELKAEWFF